MNAIGLTWEMYAHRPVEQITAFGAPVDPEVKSRSSADRGSSPSAVAPTSAPPCAVSSPAYSAPPASRIRGTAMLSSSPP